MKSSLFKIGGRMVKTALKSWRQNDKRTNRGIVCTRI